MPDKGKSKSNTVKKAANNKKKNEKSVDSSKKGLGKTKKK